jgi:hypothetical protein
MCFFSISRILASACRMPTLLCGGVGSGHCRAVAALGWYYQIALPEASFRLAFHWLSTRLVTVAGIGT